VLRVACCVLRVACCVLRVACCVLRVACYVVRGVHSCYALRVDVALRVACARKVCCIAAVIFSIQSLKIPTLNRLENDFKKKSRHKYDFIFACPYTCRHF
jgi:hypothetical protein